MPKQPPLEPRELVETATDLWSKVELRAGMTECPDGRGFHLSSRRTSAYQRQDFAVELAFCRDAEQGAAQLAALILPRLDVELRPLLPAIAEAVGLTPPHRYDAWVHKVENSGGGSSFGGFD